MRNIFVSYRREDSSDITGRIFDHLKSAFGEERLFKDVDTIAPGTDFREAIRKGTSDCAALLAVIGDGWLDAKDSAGNRRIDDPDDFVRLEISSALERKIPVIPVLVDGAEIPKESGLPEPLRPLAFRNAIPVRRDPDFRNDMERLCNALSQFVARRDGKEGTSTRRPGLLMPVAVGAIAVAITLGLLFGRGKTTTINVNNMTVINNVSVIINEYEKYEKHSLGDEELKNEINRAVAASDANESARLFEKIAAKAPIPAIYTNLGVQYAKLGKTDEAKAAFNKALAKDPAYEAALKNNELLAKVSSERSPVASASPVNGVTVETNTMTALLLESLHENAAGIREAHVVDAGTSRSGYYTVRYSLKPDSPTLVDPGDYDILVKSAGGGTFPLVQSLAVTDQTRVRINPNMLLGTIAVDPLTRSGMPEIKQLYVFEQGATGSRSIIQAADRLGVRLPIAPGKYDLKCETADGNSFWLAKNIEVKAREVAHIKSDKEIAIIVVHDPKMSGLQVNAVDVLEAGKNTIVSQTKEFDRPMLVHPGDAYDIVIEQPSGPARLKTGVTLKPGQLLEVP